MKDAAYFESFVFRLFRENDAVRAMREGISAAIVPALAQELGISQESLLDQLHLPRSTIKRRISQKALLSPSEQDRVYRVTKVLERATEVLGDGAAAKAWTLQINRSLGGESPLSLLDTEAGYERVMDTLGRIEYGVVA